MLNRDCYDPNRLIMKTLLRNFITTLTRFKMASGLNILGLSISFAAFIIITMNVQYERSYDRFHSRADRLYRLECRSDNKSGDMVGYIASSPHPLAYMIEDSVGQVEAATAWRGHSYNMTVVVDRGEEIDVFEEDLRPVTMRFLDIFDLDMAEGDARSIEDGNKVLIPQSMAAKFFGSESAIGRSLAVKGPQVLSGKTAIVVGGVYRDLPDNSVIRNDIYINLGDYEITGWGRWNYNIYLTLVSPEARQAATEAINKIDYPEKDSTDIYRLTPISEVYYSTDMLRDNIHKGSQMGANVLLAIAFLIIVIAGINFVNFSISLTPVRMKSINIQKILGSSLFALRRMMVCEAVGMAVISYGVALLMVYYIGRTPFADYIAVPLDFSTGGQTLILAAVIAVLTGVVAGVYPALYSTSFAPVLALKGSFGLSGHGRALRSVLIGFQFTVSIALIICAMFMNLQHRYMSQMSLGLNHDLVLQVKLSGNIFRNQATFAERLKSNPEISDVTTTSVPMFNDEYDNWGLEYDDGRELQFGNFMVSANFLDFMNIAVVEGRNFSPTDDSDTTGVFKAVFNATARDKYRIKVGDVYPAFNTDIEVIGFTDDVNFLSLHQPTGPFALLSLGGTGRTYIPTAYVRISGANIDGSIAHISSVIKDMDAAAFVDIRFLDDTIEAQYADDKRVGVLITIFSLLAIIISIVGIFGLVLFETQYRTKEIGLRRICGATVAEILVMLNRGFVRTVLICFVVAAVAAYLAVGYWLEAFAYRIQMSWWVFAVSLVLVMAITVGTVTFQSWRAANENPVKSLKAE